MTHKLPTNLDECHELIRRLREENANLRHAGSFFGQLAERLNRELQEERGLSGTSPVYAHSQGNHAGSTR
jgi:hypothetical protein